MFKTIDINADLGEQITQNSDAQIMPYISSCNIACGGHAGDDLSIAETINLALDHNVAIGAHPSYPDKENFGRKIMSISHEKLFKSLTSQLLLIQYLCEEHGTELKHVKPHGALYNAAAKDKSLAELICRLVKKVGSKIKLFGPPGSMIERTALKNNIPFVAEAFADRQYESDGSLRSRSLEGSVLSIEESMRQAQEIAINNRVMSDDWIPMKAQTICLHSDTNNAASLAKHINQTIRKSGVIIRSV